ncbi:MAG TPA: GAF domain-containing sensor histidine kinase [Symbiobacteriaceae bacterium]|nr:GAF domain-containing sensor histidine kinase [Symbiobacteriaceae bacterium]
MVINFALRQLDGEKAATLGERAASLLGRAGRVTSIGRYGLMIHSPTREQAIRSRLALRQASTTLAFPDFIMIPLPGNRMFVQSAGHSAGVIVRSAAWVCIGLIVMLSDLSYRRTIWWMGLVALGGVLDTAWLATRQLARSNFHSLLTAGLIQLRNHQERLAVAGIERQHFNTVQDLLPEAEYQFRHTGEVPAVCAHLVTFLHRLFPEADGLSLWMLDASQEYLEVSHATGRHSHLLHPGGIRHPKNLGATGHALQTRCPYFVRDFLSDPHVLPYLDHPEVGAGLAIPLFTSESPIGAAMISDVSQAVFPDHRVWAAEVLAGLAALRIQALKARSREQKLTADFARLHDLVEWKSDESFSSALLERLAGHLQAAAGAGAYITYCVGPDGQLAPGPCRAPTSDMESALSALPPDQTPAGQTLAGTLVCGFGPQNLTAGRSGPLQAMNVSGCVGVPITRGDGAAIAVVLLLYIGSARALPGPDLLALCETYARYAGITIHNLELYATTVRQSNQLRQLLGRVVEAQEAERRRIALDLHDWVVQGLAAPSFQLQVAERLLHPADVRVRAELESARDLLSAAGDELRRIMKGLRPYLLDELGLFRTVEAYADDWSRSHHVGCTIRMGSEEVLPRGSEEGLAGFRIIQEALNNVAKHAKATHVEITMTRVGNAVEIRIQDNGQGLQRSETGGQDHFGLLGMHERAASVGGAVVITGSPGGGCLVVCRIPVRI